MHLRSPSELQGAAAPQRGSTPWTTQDRASQSSRPRRDPSSHRSPLRGAPLWVWLLLGALVVPGALSYLSEEQEELLVELHNYYRGQVSPTASAMLPLVRHPQVIAHQHEQTDTNVRESQISELQIMSVQLFAILQENEGLLLRLRVMV